MNKILNTTLAVCLLAGINMTAAAKETRNTATKAFVEKTAAEVLPELLAETQKSGKKPGKAEITQKVFDKIRTRMDEFKAVFTEDCINYYGKEKSENCKCFLDKVDLAAHLDLMERQATDPQADTSAEQKKLEETGKAASQACGMDNPAPQPPEAQ